MQGNKSSKSGNFAKLFFSSAKMATATFSSRILGLVREQVMAHMFGASGMTDAFLVAYRIPNMLRDLFAEGAFSSAFVPTFAEAKIKSLEHARRLLWALFISLFLITGTLSVLIYIFAPQIISLFAPSFLSDSEKLATTVTLTRIMSPFLLLVSLAALFMGALNSLKVFFIPALSPAFFNVVMILSMLTLPPVMINMGFPAIVALGFGVLLGGFVQAMVQFPMILKKNLAPKWPKKICDHRVKKVFKKLGPGLIGFSATQVNLLVNTILATGTVVGAVSCLSYAFRLFQFPVGILGVSIGNSNLVHFSDAWKGGERERAIDFLGLSYTLSLFIVILAMALMSSLSPQIVHIVFEHGQFTNHSTVMTSLALDFYLLGLPFYALYKIFVPTFYAMDRQNIPVISSIISIALNVIFCVVMTPIYGFKILALGTSISMLVNTLIQAYYLRKLLLLKFNFYLNPQVLKFITAGVLTYLLVHWMGGKWFHFESSIVEKLLLLLLFILIGLVNYCLILLLLGEGKILRKTLKRD